MLILDAELRGEPCDVRLANGRITDVVPAGALTRAAGEESHDAAHGALLPGLHDHHIHLMALSATAQSVSCGPPGVRTPGELARALTDAKPRDGWIRGVGYHDSVAGPLDRHRLDALRSDHPVRVQHRSGACWSLNSAALARIGPLEPGLVGVERTPAGEATGRLFGLDAWIRTRLPRSAPPDLRAVGRELASFGVTGVTDATATNGAEALAHLEDAVEAGDLPQRLHVMGTLELPNPSARRVVRAAHKVVLSERDLPDPDSLAERFRAAHDLGRTVAVHCTTRSELVLACAAFTATGTVPGDRIEHASIAPPEVTALLSELELTVVTQPHFISERGDAYRREVAAEDRAWLYRGAGFCEAGVPLGGGTDAPFGAPDPWRAIAAAVDRITPDGEPLGAEEALTPERAVALFTSPPSAPGGPPRTLEPGAPADLVLLDRPWAEARSRLDARLVRATWCEGERVYSAR